MPQVGIGVGVAVRVGVAVGVGVAGGGVGVAVGVAVEVGVGVGSRSFQGNYRRYPAGAYSIEPGRVHCRCRTKYLVCRRAGVAGAARSDCAGRQCGEAAASRCPCQRARVALLRARNCQFAGLRRGSCGSGINRTAGSIATRRGIHDYDAADTAPLRKLGRHSAGSCAKIMHRYDGRARSVIGRETNRIS